MRFVANNEPVTRAVTGKTPEYVALEGRTEGKIRKQARASFKLMRDGVDVDGVTAGIEAREWKSAFDATGIETTAASIGKIEPHIEEAMVKAADIALDEVAIPLQRGDLTTGNLQAKTFSLVSHLVYQFKPGYPVRESGVVLNPVCIKHLSAGSQFLDEYGLQARAG